MPTFQRKTHTIEAREHTDGHALVVVSDEKGQQVARKGDYLVGNERGKITVWDKADFEREYEAAPESEPENVDKPDFHFENEGDAQAFNDAPENKDELYTYTVGEEPTVLTHRGTPVGADNTL